MKEYTHGNLKAGLNSVRSAKLRSFWTMLGVIIGVASVITVVAIGEGIKQQVGHQIHHLGKDVIIVKPAQLHGNGGVKSGGVDVLSGLNISGSLTDKDVAVVSKTNGVEASAPLTITTGKITRDKTTFDSGFVIGTTQDLPMLLNQSVAYGSFFTDDDAGSNVAILGDKAAQKLFDEELPLGRTFMYHGQEFVVRGIFNQFNATPLTEQADLNEAIFIPNDVAETISKNTAPTYEILIKPNTPSQVGKVAAAVNANLQRAHGYQTNFDVIQGDQNFNSNDTILALLTKLIAGVAAISLFVGGIGIMNVMLVSVAERMHEIGIRKAVGATNRQILNQFMFEASILSLIGGILGIVLAYFVDISLRLTTDLNPVISWQVVLIATGVSLLVGIVFGSFPALKAARKDPIDALRSE